MAAITSRLKAILEWWKQTRVARALARYGAANGALLSGGIAYSALFSIFAGLTIGYTIFMAVLGSNTELRDAVLDSLNDAVPGLVDTGDGGLVKPDDLELNTGTGIVGVIAVVVLVNAATTVMAALRTAIRAMFGIVAPKENVVVSKLRDLGGYFGLAIAVLLTSALGIAVGAAGEFLLGLVGAESSAAGSWALRIAGFLVVLGMDLLVFVMLYRVLAGVHPPNKDLWVGALVAAVGAGALRFLGTSVVGSVSGNPLLAGFAAIVTLLLWVNLVVRVTLMVAAWTANPPPAPEITAEMITHLDEHPNYVTVSEPATLEWDHDPVTGKIRPEDPLPEPDRWGGLIGWLRRKWRAVREESQSHRVEQERRRQYAERD
ncbi:YihY/virulence factor BrkB family protein [Occultella glacieicola]|uniref:YihY/virulence factor BrkB family protein n=1 Tax=Occultella glacieicola TaxID=2518684 RepID=A0ABY2ECI8_9MICO|nr:YihY/virulence factor BrkB family protein [Occultella glacieicola]TDE97554.1 YihY/virulence factor BrkB family protein [Occultella glacieicola]